MRVLVLVEDYPDNSGKKAMSYVHVRNKYYSENGIEVVVLNFQANERYKYDGICVITALDFDIEDEYDILIAHAANLKHHYLFIRKYEKYFPKLMFFFHGHEVLKVNKVYSKPYEYNKKSIAKIVVQNCYDEIKLFVWRKYFKKINDKVFYIFVSKWMHNEFLKWTRVPEKMIHKRYSITYNCVGEKFEKGCYNSAGKKKYDFVTIRNDLDGSKYAVDLVNQMAKNTPEARFLLVGKGEFFKHNIKANNLDWKSTTLNHDEIMTILQGAKYALMPTRTDAQGLMMCEMAAFGIPVITSDISVCHEVFDGFENVYFISNEDYNQNLSAYCEKEVVSIKDTRFFMKKTVEKEIELLFQLIKEEENGE